MQTAQLYPLINLWLLIYFLASMTGSISQKHFESTFTKFYEGYWLPSRFNFDTRRVQLSSLIVTNQMSRESALSKLKQDPYDPIQLDIDKSFIADKLGITVDQLMLYHSCPKSFTGTIK